MGISFVSRLISGSNGWSSLELQIGVHAAFAPIAITNVVFSPLTTNRDMHSSVGVRDAVTVIPAEALRCMNLGGLDFWGQAFRHPNVTVPQGDVTALWVAVVVPNGTTSGVYTGQCNVQGMQNGTRIFQNVTVSLTVAGAVVPNGGDDDVERGKSSSALHLSNC